jgi:hypothetical protein
VAKDGVDVDGGLFEVNLDFGHDLFTGEACYLAIGVRAEGEPGGFTALTPRQAFIPVPSAWEYPYAVYAADIKSSGEGQRTALTVVGIRATDGNGTFVLPGTGNSIYGGTDSTVYATTDYSTIGGGRYNIIGHETTDGIDYCTVGGGFNSVASGHGATVAGGYENAASWLGATVGGGVANTASDSCATVGGGSANTADKMYATVAGGYLNKANGDAAFVGGGRYNEASGLYAVVPGGRKNRAVNYAFAAGYRAKAAHTGCFVWGDKTEANITTTAKNQFLARAKGGVKFFTNAAMTSGAKLNPGGGSWVNMSDRATKENVRPIDAKEVLDRLAKVPVQTWNYKSQDAAIRHMGVMSQDLHAAFGLGVDDKGIATVDGLGISMAAIQGLNQKVDRKSDEKDARIAQLERELADLKALVHGLAK